MTKRYFCPACLSRSMAVRLDKKGRPMLGCEMCSQVIFARSALKLFNMLAVSKLLDDREMLRFVRESAVQQAARPTALADLLRETEDGSLAEPSQQSQKVAANE